jgi:hypothetical protein
MERFPNVRRFPRLAPEDTIAELTASVLTQVRRHRQSRIEIGRNLIQLKDKVGHGNWETYFAKHFGEHLSLRCAQKYMKSANREDTQKRTRAFLKLGGGSHAESIRDAEKMAEAEEAHKRKEQKILLDRDIRALTTELLKLASWPEAHEEIRCLVMKLEIKYAIRGKKNEAVAA